MLSLPSSDSGSSLSSAAGIWASQTLRLTQLLVQIQTPKHMQTFLQICGLRILPVNRNTPRHTHVSWAIPYIQQSRCQLAQTSWFLEGHQFTSLVSRPLHLLSQSILIVHLDACKITHPDLQVLSFIQDTTWSPATCCVNPFAAAETYTCTWDRLLSWSAMISPVLLQAEVPASLKGALSICASATDSLDGFHGFHQETEADSSPETAL